MHIITDIGMASKFGAEVKAVGVWSSDVGKQVKIVRNNNDNNLLIFPLPIFPLHGENKGKNYTIVVWSFL